MLDKQLLPEKDAVMDEFTGELLRWMGAALIFVSGGAHLLIAGEHFLAATYLGVLFLANFAGSAAAAFALYWSPRIWGWLLGGLVASGAFLGFLISRIFGLPGAPDFEGQWFTIVGLLTLMIEGAFLTLSLLAITPQGRALLRIEQRRVEREEELPPAVQETPAHFEHIEQEMAETRSRMAPQLVDLRRHVEPGVVKEQVRQSTLEYLRGIRGALTSASESRQPGPLAALVVLFAVVVLVLRRTGGRGD